MALTRRGLFRGLAAVMGGVALAKVVPKPVNAEPPAWRYCNNPGEGFEVAMAVKPDLEPMDHAMDALRYQTAYMSDRVYYVGGDNSITYVTSRGTLHRIGPDGY